MQRLFPIPAILLGVFLMTAHPVTAQQEHPEDMKRPALFGVNRVGGLPVYPPEGYFEDMYVRIRECNGTAVRLQGSPWHIEKERGERDWEEFDRDLELAVQYGQEPMVCIVNTPTWALPELEVQPPAGMAPEPRYPYADKYMDDFVDFCRDLAERTKGRVKYFQLWNEQNGASWHFWDGGWNYIDDYMPMLVAARKGLEQGNPEALLFLGGLDDAEGNGHIFLERYYLQRDEKYGGQELIDGVTVHPYDWSSQNIRAKLEELRGIMVANGDGDLPMWITEYGWHTRDIPEKDRVRLTHETFDMLQEPDMDYMQGAIQLCISDFEGGIDGFGLCDANLRPRPAFYAFQGAVRFGASPAHTIHWRPVDGRALEITYETLLPTTGVVHYRKAATGDWQKAEEKAEQPGNKHAIRLTELDPGAAYEFKIETITSESGKSFTSAPLMARTVGKGVWNGNFEEGFFAGIADGWTVQGHGFATDADLIPGVDMEDGRHAQAMFAVGNKGQQLNSTAWAWAGTEPGATYTLSARWQAASVNTRARVRVRAGLDPAGGNNPEAEGIVWSDWEGVGAAWQPVELSVEATGEVATVFIQTRAIGEGGTPAMAFDQVKLEKVD